MGDEGRELVGVISYLTDEGRELVGVISYRTVMKGENWWV